MQRYRGKKAKVLRYDKCFLLYVFYVFSILLSLSCLIHMFNICVVVAPNNEL